MNTVLYQPTRKDTHIILLILRILSHNRLLNGARNLELQHRQLCLFQQVLTFRQQLRRRLERVQHSLHLLADKQVVSWGATSAACLDRGFCSQRRHHGEIHQCCCKHPRESVGGPGEDLSHPSLGCPSAWGGRCEGTLIPNRVPVGKRVWRQEIVSGRSIVWWLPVLVKSTGHETKVGNVLSCC